MHKKLRKSLVYVILLALVLIAAVWFSIDGILRSQIQSRATAALGTKTTLADAQLSILGGSLALTGLTVDNLKGYTAPPAIATADVPPPQFAAPPSHKNPPIAIARK